jgi:hypothetical protein
MQTRRDSVRDLTGDAIPDTKALLWGNNAAWLCVRCEQLLGNRTDNDFELQCNCGAEYEIVRGVNRSGQRLLARALEVRRLDA